MQERIDQLLTKLENLSLARDKLEQQQREVQQELRDLLARPRGLSIARAASQGDSQPTTVVSADQIWPTDQNAYETGQVVYITNLRIFDSTQIRQRFATITEVVRSSSGHIIKLKLTRLYGGNT